MIEVGRDRPTPDVSPDPPKSSGQRMALHLYSFGIDTPEEPTEEERQQQILQQFSPEEQEQIQEYQERLSALARYISKDFSIPVLLNEPGKGWHWNFDKNVIRVDPKDLLQKPIDYLRFVVAHEGAHRRVTHFDRIPEKLWQEPGFSFLSNAVEDPRINNYVVSAYARFMRYLRVVYQATSNTEAALKDRADKKLGYQPKFMQAGFEYIRQWYLQLSGGKTGKLRHLERDIRKVIRATLADAQEAWSYFPTKAQVDRSITASIPYADTTHTIIRDKIWPLFRELVEKDLKDQRVQELLKEMQKRDGGSSSGNEGSGGGISEELKRTLSKREQRALENLLKPGDGQAGEAVSLEKLPRRLRKKLERHLASQSESEQARVTEKAKQSLRDFEQDMQESLQEMLEKHDFSEADDQGEGQGESEEGRSEPGNPGNEGLNQPQDGVPPGQYTEDVRRVTKENRGLYEKTLRRVRKQINELERNLRNIFRERRKRRWNPLHRSGRSINIRSRLGEVAKGVPATESRAWKRREAPLERDYAISLVIDLTGSMRGENIEESFKGLVALAEPLSRLGIRYEILGFNSVLHVYKEFQEKLTPATRARTGSLVDETAGREAGSTDDGWAIHQASERLNTLKARRKFIIVITDGCSNPSAQHAQKEYRLPEVLRRVRRDTDQVVVALGIGKSTAYVPKVYANGIGQIEAKELPRTLVELLERIIQEGEKFAK